MKYRSLFRGCWLTKYLAIYGGGVCCHRPSRKRLKLKTWLVRLF